MILILRGCKLLYARMKRRPPGGNRRITLLAVVGMRRCAYLWERHGIGCKYGGNEAGFMGENREITEQPRRLKKG